MASRPLRSFWRSASSSRLTWILPFATVTRRARSFCKVFQRLATAAPAGSLKQQVGVGQADLVALDVTEHPEVGGKRS